MITTMKATEGVGNNTIKKEIFKGSEAIIYDVLQNSQYSFPVKSSVREIVSNGLDSVTEKNNSLKIMSGKMTVEDLYMQKEGEEFKSSNWDSAYYDKKWLNPINEVRITYVENATNLRDAIEFTDTGVGLGMNRLIDSFSLGYSSKRLSKSQLGSFGLGSKSLLSTGVEFYTVCTNHNGLYFEFDVYKDHIASVIPKFEDDGTENEVYEFYTGFKSFYRKTKELNGVTIKAEVKRHRREEFISAIENQLGFISEVKLFIKDARYPEYAAAERNIKNTILFQNKDILVGDSDYYAVPQIILKPGENSDKYISYGAIAFDELEMKSYRGNVSFILNINEVDVTPSRESVIWNSRTREAVKGMFVKAQETISGMIADKLGDATYLEDHLFLLDSFKSGSKLTGMSELYKVIDTENLDVKFRNFDYTGMASVLTKSMDKDIRFAYSNIYNLYNADWDSNFSKSFLGKLSKQNTYSFKDTTIYIGEVRYKALFKYVNNKFSLSSDVNLIQIKPELYKEYEAKIEKVGLDVFIHEAYDGKLQKDILMATLFSAIRNGIRVLKEEDVDRAELKKADEVEKRNVYMSHAEREKAKGKVVGYDFRSSNYSQQQYYDESTLELQGVSNVIIYSMGSQVSKDILSSANGYSNLPSNYKIIGFSSENFIRFKKVAGVKTLSNELYTIKFGDFRLTKLGRYFFSNLDDTLRDEARGQGGGKSPSLGSLSFLNRTFKDYTLNKKVHNDHIMNIIERRERKIEEALKKDNAKEIKFNKLLK